ncbi:unnamed protein product [Rotaria sordida]|uniref:NAD(P)(+)--arginine ADP-ribosyltransferase n=1 Tax=Rotaria sordida TaxID=392033 RepID=A0A814LT16_9BILA|nr:unnamed protein product [Rotaria sordida]CAF1253045.1 unnamed protein product [Rotaria sordida]
MYKQILLNTDQCFEDSNAKSELITLCQKQYPTSYANDIQRFEHDYQSNIAIQWYTEDSFVYRLINRALRTQDLECLYVLRFYIRDLSRFLSEDWKIWRDCLELGYFVHLYRGQVVSHSRRCELEQNQGKIVSTNGYWSMSRREQIAKIFASIGQTPEELNGESILFDIEVDLNASEQVLADISRFSKNPNEEEVLFDLDATFQIESVIEEQENQIPYWRVRMKMTNDNGMACIQQSIDQRRLYDSTGFDQMWSVTPNINPFDALLHLNDLFNYLHRFELAVLQVPTSKIKQDDAALLNYIQAAELILKVGPKQPLELEQQKVLCQATMHLTLSEHLFSLDDRNEFVRLSQRALGMVHFKGGNYSYSIKQWTRIWNENDTTDRFHTMICCFYLGLTYSKMHQHSKAIDFFQRALTYTDDLPPIFQAQCRMQIGHSIELQAIEISTCFTTARANYEKALDLYENHITPIDEAALALCYAIIGNCYSFENAWTDDSHKYYLKAIDVYDAVFVVESLSPMFVQQVRCLLTGILFHIGLRYYKELRLIDKAQKCFERIVTYPIEHCAFDSYALAHRYLGQIFSLHHNKHERALDHFQKSVQFYETYAPEDFWELAFCHQWLTMTHVKLEDDQSALDHGNKTVSFLMQANLSKSSATLSDSNLTYFKQITIFQPESEDTAKEQMKNQTLSETYR